MLAKVRTGLFLGCFALMAFWYLNPPNKPNPSPEPPEGPLGGVSVLVESEVEEFPPAPPEAVQKLLEPITGMFSQYPSDALELARASEQWGDLMDTSLDLGNLTQFIKVQDSAFRNLGKTASLKGSYATQLNPILKSVYLHYLPQLKDAEGNVTGTEIDPSVRKSLQNYFDAVSWKLSNEWLKESVKKKTNHTNTDSKDS